MNFQKFFCRETALAFAFSLFAGSALGEEAVEMELELERSSNLGNWEGVPITHDMLSESGKIRLPVDGNGAFFRLKIEIPLVGPDQEFALIPAGHFDMGDGLGDGRELERPVHSVNLSAFYMGRTPVTKSQWDAVSSWASNAGYTDLPVGDGKGPNHPVQGVNWYDAVKWLNAWSEKDGRAPVYRVSSGIFKTGENTPLIDYSADGYRLPTEAEWEKAARGGLNGKRFPWGDTISHAETNYRARGNAFTYDVSPYTEWTYHPDYKHGTTPYTSPVGSFAANGYGLYDMAGNVSGWCNDWFSDTYYHYAPEADPRGPSSGSARVFRGGGWGINANGSRVAIRGDFSPGFRYYTLGFRPARSYDKSGGSLKENQEFGQK